METSVTIAPNLGGEIPDDPVPDDPDPDDLADKHIRSHRKAKDINWNTCKLCLKSVLAITPRKMVPVFNKTPRLRWYLSCR